MLKVQAVGLCHLLGGPGAPVLPRGRRVLLLLPRCRARWRVRRRRALLLPRGRMRMLLLQPRRKVEPPGLLSSPSVLLLFHLVPYL